jgi:SMODS and SLOG-associating 2TM effector domain family 4
VPARLLARKGGTVFQLTLHDHLRLTFGQVVYDHKAHVNIACTRARWSRWLRATEALLMAGVAFATFAAAFGRGYANEIVAAILAGLALVTLLFHLTFDLEGSAQSHASCATRLWQIGEQYRALLSDLSDRAIELETARCRRDALMNELAGVYGNAPPADHHASPMAAQSMPTADEAALT